MLSVGLDFLLGKTQRALLEKSGHERRALDVQYVVHVNSSEGSCDAGVGHRRVRLRDGWEGGTEVGWLVG